MFDYINYKKYKQEMNSYSYQKRRTYISNDLPKKKSSQLSVIFPLIASPIKNYKVQFNKTVK